MLRRGGDDEPRRRSCRVSRPLEFGPTQGKAWTSTDTSRWESPPPREAGLGGERAGGGALRRRQRARSRPRRPRQDLHRRAQGVLGPRRHQLGHQPRPRRRRGARRLLRPPLQARPGRHAASSSRGRWSCSAVSRTTQVTPIALPDFKASDPYYRYVQIAVHLGLLGRFKDGFHPTAAVSSWQVDGAVVRLLRTLNPSADWTMLSALRPADWQPNPGLEDRRAALPGHRDRGSLPGAALQPPGRGRCPRGLSAPAGRSRRGGRDPLPGEAPLVVEHRGSQRVRQRRVAGPDRPPEADRRLRPAVHRLPLRLGG